MAIKKRTKPSIPSFKEILKEISPTVEKSTFLDAGKVEDFKRNITENDAASDYELYEAREPGYEGYRTQTAPTSNAKKPRALMVGYSMENQNLVVRFRDGTWWVYKGVPIDMWNELKASPSTGKYLASSGLDVWSDMGPFNPSDMSVASRVLFNM